MKRLDLLRCLTTVSPALGNIEKRTIPMLGHLCFDGKNVTAYDGLVALRAPCDLDIRGGLPGEMLLSMLSATASEDATCVLQGSGVELKLGRARLKMAMLPPEEFAFKEPSRKRAVSVELNDDMLTAIGLASRCCTDNDLVGLGKGGLTLAFGKQTVLWSTDGPIMIRAVVNSTSELKPVLLSKRFVDLLIKVGVRELLFTEGADGVGAVVGLGEGVELFGRTHTGPNPDVFVKVFKGSDARNVTKAEVPAGLSRCLERVMVINKELVELTYESGKLSLHTTGVGSELSDSVKIDLGKDAVTVVTCPEFIRRYLDVAEYIGISSRCVVLSGAGFSVLVAVQQS